MKYQLVLKETNEVVTPHYVGLFPNGELYSDGMNVTERYHIRKFTGIKDMNENEIYEGDVLKAEGMFLSVVIFQNGTFRFDGGSPSIVEDFDYYFNFEVVGNIYENPELLEQK